MALLYLSVEISLEFFATECIKKVDNDTCMMN